MKLRKLAILVSSCFMVAGAVAAEQPAAMKEAVSKAVLNNPEVLAKWHAFKAASKEREVSAGGFRPSLDFQASLGWENRDTPLFNGDYDVRGASLVLRQMLYDGFAVRNDVKRLDHAARVRYFEMLEASEAVALEAARAYGDVVRYTKLTQLAEENYATHRVVFDQIREKAGAGVGRKVDMELAAGRLALAESNLLTELSNLHDVSARYQRIVGELPPQNPADPQPLTRGIAASPAEGLKQAIGGSPLIQATMENIMAAQADAKIRNAAFQPRFDLVARTGVDRNLQGVSGNHEVSSVNLVMGWNLYRGGSDTARVGQYGEQINVAKDLRDKACRDVRQTLLIAMNDVRKINENLGYLDQHQLSISKAREAFRQQFDIGQRTLLDLLDTENEYFDARRAYLNSETDLKVAQARVHAASGSLLSTLNLAPVEAKQPAQVEAPGEDVIARCPMEGINVMAVDKEKAFERALANSRGIRQQAAPVPAIVPANRITLSARELFRFDSATLSNTGESALDREVIARLPEMGEVNMVIVTGHADRLGSDRYNQVLSEKRANAVKDYLVKSGMKADLIKTVGMGESQPVAGISCDEKAPLKKQIECLAPNRRVVVEIQADPRK